MNGNAELLEIFVPTAPGKTAKIKMSSQIDTLAGKRLGLFWNRKPNGDLLLTRFGDVLKKVYPDLKICGLQGKGDPAQNAPPAALEEARQKCDLVILAAGD